MHDAQWWSTLRFVHICSFVCLILVGCGEKGDTDGSAAGGGMTRLILHVMIAAQGRSGLTSRAGILGQTRQAADISLLRVEVTGVGLTPIVVDCPIPAGSPPQCQVTETPEAFIIVIELRAPNGSGRQVALTGFNSTGTAILRGTATIDLTGAPQDVGVLITDTGVLITPGNPNPSLTGSIGTTATLRGNGSSDVDGHALTFAWALLTRPSGSQAAVVHPTGVNPTLVVDHPGTYRVQLTVNNGQMDSLPEVVTIHTVDVDGSELAPDDDLLPFAWSLIATPPHSTAVLSDSSAENPTLTVDLPGIYVVQLIVNAELMDSAHGDSDN